MWIFWILLPCSSFNVSYCGYHIRRLAGGSWTSDRNGCNKRQYEDLPPLLYLLVLLSTFIFCVLLYHVLILLMPIYIFFFSLKKIISSNDKSPMRVRYGIYFSIQLVNCGWIPLCVVFPALSLWLIWAVFCNHKPWNWQIRKCHCSVFGQKPACVLVNDFVVQVIFNVLLMWSLGLCHNIQSRLWL